MVDGIITQKLKQVEDPGITIKHDEEEQEELSLTKQYAHFSEEAKELHDQLPSLRGNHESTDRIEEGLRIFEAREREWNARFKTLEKGGLDILDWLKTKLEEEGQDKKQEEG